MADRSPLILPNSGRAYDPNVAQDHTGVQFQTRGTEDSRAARRDPKYDPSLFIKDAAWFTCQRCLRSNAFKILTETNPRGDGCSQIVCDCGMLFPVLQFSQPQVNDAIARKLGIAFAAPPSFDIDIELAKGD